MDGEDAFNWSKVIVKTFIILQKMADENSKSLGSETFV